MYIEKIVKNESISVAVPLTKGTEKTRIKSRSIMNEYGVPVATKQTPLSLNHYVEWQIGYDVVTDEEEKLKRSSLQNFCFIGANGKEKALYELSEYVWYFHKWGFISKLELENLSATLKTIPDDCLFDINAELAIKRSHFVEKKFNGLPFFFTKVEYPMLVHKFDNFEIVTEIIIREKQYAIGVQPMLYLCFPVTELICEPALIGRKATTNEKGLFKFSASNYGILMKLLHQFGMLSKNHRHDILKIIEVILREAADE